MTWARSAEGSVPRPPAGLLEQVDLLPVAEGHLEPASAADAEGGAGQPVGAAGGSGQPGGLEVDGPGGRLPAGGELGGPEAEQHLAPVGG